MTSTPGRLVSLITHFLLMLVMMFYDLQVINFTKKLRPETIPEYFRTCYRFITGWDNQAGGLKLTIMKLNLRHSIIGQITGKIQRFPGKQEEYHWKLSRFSGKERVIPPEGGSSE